MMECVTAQQVISAALDREPIDSYQLEEAKQHCRTCAECGVFVRAQLVTQQVALPTPPADLADSVIVRIRAEAAETAERAAAAAQAAAEASAAAEEAARAARAAATPIATLAPKPRTARKLPRIWVSAAAAAAVVVALLGTGAIVIFGMKQMSGPTTSATSGVYENKNITTQEFGAGANDMATGSVPRSAPATGAQSITVNGTVYRLVGSATVNTSTTTLVGSTTTALDGAGASAKRDVYAGPSAAEKVYVADDAGALLEFARVTRTYSGLTFVMTSPELTAYSQWPSLPTQIAAPTSADGAPTFVYDGTDSSGTRVYRLANSTATQGIAIAPDSPKGDPAGGNPNWTWWAIVH